MFFRKRGVEMIDWTYNKKIPQIFWISRKLLIETWFEKFKPTVLEIYEIECR